jgi:2-oxoglutarate ferredoxin oxidoreductase subunit alpha
LRFAVHAGHGEFPRIVLASGDIRECFYDAAKAFNYAERYQLPVIHLIDKAMANCSQTYPIFNTDQFKIERGNRVDEATIQGQPYKRFLFTESGVSPRAVVGTKDAVHWHTGDEHNEFGHISEEPVNRRLMMEKRLRKLELVDKEIPNEERVNLYGDRDADNLIVSWGSPKGAIIETIEKLKAEGFGSLGFLQIRMIHPLPKEFVMNTLKHAKKIIDVESNYFGQLGGIIREETGVPMNFYVLKYTGRPMTTTEIYDSVKNILEGKAAERQALTYGP